MNFMNGHWTWCGIDLFCFRPMFLIRCWFVRWITGSSAQSNDQDFDYCSDDEDDEEKDREEKKTIKERLQTIQEVSQSVQNTIGHIASLGESIKKYEKFLINTYNINAYFISIKIEKWINNSLLCLFDL